MKLLAGVALLALVAGTDDPWARQVEKGADRFVAALADEGYQRDGALLTGALLLGESTSRSIELNKAGHYAVIGVCDDDCGALHLVLITPTRYEVDADDGRTPGPVVHGTLAEPAHYTVRVTMVGCRVSPCRYGIVVLRKGK